MSQEEHAVANRTHDVLWDKISYECTVCNATGSSAHRNDSVEIESMSLQIHDL